MFNTLSGLGLTSLSTQMPSTNFNLISVFEKDLQYIAQEHIQQLCRKIYPVEVAVSNHYHALYRTLINYFAIQSNKGNSYEDIIADVLRIASSISEALSIKLTETLKKDEVKKKLFDNTRKPSEAGGSTSNNSSGVGSKSSARGLFSTTLLQNLGTKYREEGQGKYASLLNRQLNDAYRKDNSVQDAGASAAEKYMKDKSSVENLAKRIQFQRELREMGDFANKRCLICDACILQSPAFSHKMLFQCKDCGEMYHKKCMPRDNNCCVCQLRHINPLQKAKTLLFLGILKRGTKRHEIEFELRKQQEESSWQVEQRDRSGKKTMVPNVELRCLRLKEKNDTVANFINLFPDACTVMVNNRVVKEFQPLHKQSALKYRRDECIKLSTNMNVGINKITITERILKKEIKTDERIDLQNHLVGVYTVQNLQVPKPPNKLELFLTKSGYSAGNTPAIIQKFLSSLGSIVTAFGQSQNLLRKSLYIRNEEGSMSEQQQQIACEYVKAPLMCSLTLQKMRYPGRSIFCKHFACFDVYNFILLNAQAKLPKWQCPICKASAYKFQIDCILKSIVDELQRIAEINKFRQEEEPVQAEFDSKFNIRFFSSEAKLLVNKQKKIDARANLEFLASEAIPNWLSSIYDLPIEGKSKRERLREQSNEYGGRKTLLISCSNDSGPPSQGVIKEPTNIDNIEIQSQIQESSSKLENRYEVDPKMKGAGLVEQQEEDDSKVASPKCPHEQEKERICHVSDGDANKRKRDEVGGGGAGKLNQKQVSCKSNQFEQEPLSQKLFDPSDQDVGSAEEQNVPIPMSASDKMSQDEIQMEQALREYEEQRKLKNARCVGENQKQTSIVEREPIVPSDTFHPSYYSYPAEPQHAETTQKNDEDLSHEKDKENLGILTEEQKSVIGLQEPEAHLMGNTDKLQSRNKWLQTLKEQKNYEEATKKSDINLFKSYTTRYSVELQKGTKRKLLKSVDTLRKTGGQSSKGQGASKDIGKRARQREKGTDFILPEDVDIIQLSD